MGANKQNVYIGNDEVDRVLMGIPKDHKHVRTMLEIRNKRLILQEATIASIVRAFTTLKTHPTLHGVELRKRTCETRKNGYAAHQLLESEKSSDDVILEMHHIMQQFTTHILKAEG